MAVQSQTVFTQQRNGTKLVFSLGHDKLAFTHSDASGENSREIAWEQIDLENSSTVLAKGYLVKRPDKVLLYIGAFLLLMARAPRPSMLLAGGIVFICLGVRVYYSRRRGIGYTIFKTAQNPIRIIQDKQHDLILAELRKRRGQRLKEMFGVVNKANDPAKETAKFQWLKAIGAITQEELELATAEIQDRNAHPMEFAAPVIH